MSLAVKSEARNAVRNAGWLVVQRGLLIAGGFVFAALVPRLLGPERYGQYVLVNSLATWFVLFSTLGFTQVVGRYAPPLTLGGDTAGLRRLFGNLVMVRCVSGTLMAGLYWLFTTLWLRELDPVLLALMAGVVLGRAIANLGYLFFLGLNQAARWGWGELARQWATLAGLIPGFLLGGLRGAAVGLVLAELSVLVGGFWRLRAYLSWADLRVEWRYLAPYLRFGLGFFVGDLLTSAFQHSGEALVRAVAGDYTQVGYFGLAFSIYLMAPVALMQLTLAFAPLLTGLRLQGESEALRRWVERLLKGLTVGGMLVIFTVLLLGADLVPLVLGKAYRPVAANLVPLALTLLPLALSSVGSLLALVYERPRTNWVAAGLRLAAFWLLGPLLVATWGGLGGCLAVLAASLLQAGYFTWQMRRVVRYALWPWAGAVLAGGWCLPLVLLRSSGLVNLALYGVGLISYGSLLWAFHVVTPGELVTAWQTMGLKVKKGTHGSG